MITANTNRRKHLRKHLAKSRRREEFNSYVKSILDSDIIHKMKEYPQHGVTSCFEHCLDVAYYNYRICNMLGWDSKSAARAGLLHDFFLYDWHRYKNEHGSHIFAHPKIAAENARKHYGINAKEDDMIRRHMFPAAAFPKHKETYVISIVDKYCTLKETFKPKLRTAANFIASGVSRFFKSRG